MSTSVLQTLPDAMPTRNLGTNSSLGGIANRSPISYIKRANSQMQNNRGSSLEAGKEKSTLRMRQDWQSYIMNSSTHDVLKDINIEKRPIRY